MSNALPLFKRIFCLNPQVYLGCVICCFAIEILDFEKETLSNIMMPNSVVFPSDILVILDSLR